jgi:phospholipid/cholesterol/gamma-HCH transport system ATP-binding protein
MDDEAMSSRVADCLTRVELEGHGDKYPGELSGGMQKRVGIARAISMNPKYLFCDEPNSGLDPQTAIVIDNLIVDITREYGMTTVVVSHDMNSVIEASDTIHFIHEGEIAFKGDNAEMMVSDSETLNDFIYASKLMRKLRDKAK